LLQPNCVTNNLWAEIWSQTLINGTTEIARNAIISMMPFLSQGL